MLREALPEIVTGSVPGPKAAELLKRRDAAIPKAMCGTTYPICMGRDVYKRQLPGYPAKFGRSKRLGSPESGFLSLRTV